MVFLPWAEHKVNYGSQQLQTFKAAGLEKGSSKPNVSKAGKITKAQVREIAEKKMPDLNAKNIEGAMKIVEGSARSAGISIVD